MIGLFWYNLFRFGSIFEAGYTLWSADRHFVNFNNPLWIGLADELLSPGKGLFLYCPILILAGLGLRRFCANHRLLASTFIAASMIYLVFFAKYKAWHGDNAWGPRYFTFLIPFWMLCVAEFLQSGFRNWTGVSRVAVQAIIVASFLIQLASVMVDMNLHYQKLLMEGVIQNVETYAYPSKIYFQVEYSPLLDRFREIPQALAWRSPHATSGMVPRLDFWWLQSSSIGRYGWILMCPFLLEGILSGYRIRTLLKARDCP